MRNKLFILGASLCLFFGATSDLFAQRYQPAKAKGQAASNRFFKRSPKFSLMGGMGLVVMNSDNRKSSWSDGLGNIMRQNGLGAELGLGAMYQIAPNVALRGNLNYLSFNTDLYDRVGYDLPFSTGIGEFTGAVVINLISPYLPAQGTHSSALRRLMVPYITGGVGAVYYNASSEHAADVAQNASVIAANDHSGFATVIPVGAGIRINYSPSISFAPEVLLRYTTTDYLDNLQRSGGYTGDNDAYVSATINMIYTLPSKRKFSFKRGR